MKVKGFNEYLERMLIEIAATQKHKIMPAELREIHHEKFAGSPESWLELAIHEMELRGWGKDGRKVGRSDFFIEGAGLAEVEGFREKYRPKTLFEGLLSMPRSDWIAIGAFVVSVVALLKD